MNTKMLKRIKAEERRLAKKTVRRVRKHVQVLGTGYPWFFRKEGSVGYVVMRLVTTKNGSTDVPLKIGDLGAYQKIKLIAEYTK